MNNVRWIVMTQTLICGHSYPYDQLMKATEDASLLRAATGQPYRVHALIAGDGKSRPVYSIF